MSSQDAYETKKECDGSVAQAVAKFEIFFKRRPKMGAIDRFDSGLSVKRESSPETDDCYFKCMSTGNSLHRAS